MHLQAAETSYSVEISVNDVSQTQTNDETTLLRNLLQQHLDIVKWRDNPRMSPAEWLRLYQATPQAIADLLATEGYFSHEITPSIDTVTGVSQAKFLVNPGKPVLVNAVDISFTGDILQQDPAEQSARLASIATLRQNWLLQPGAVFKQSDWSQAKRRLLVNLLVERYPNASIKASKAEVDPTLNKVTITLEVDSGQSFTFGELEIEGLQRYPASIIQDLNRIRPGTTYSQARLQILQSRLEESGYFQGVEVTASTTTAVNDVVPIKVSVQENPSIKLGAGAGYSTNTGARAQLTYDDLNLFNRGWRLTSSLKPEQRAQSLSALVRLPTDSDGYRDSLNAGLERRVIEGQITTSGQTGINRSWGPRRTEQTVGAAYLIEHQALDGAESVTRSVATLSYGITLRRTDNDRNPTRGYLFNTQLAVAPIEQLSSGRFLQSYAKVQGYYPLTSSTQLIARAEIGAVSGRNSAPAAFLFRAGGDQSIRGYAFESLGVREGDATVGGRYLATGSIEAIQWLTQQWGAAIFVDAGNAANTLQDLKPVYGYGLGARWKSPIGAIGGDIAYGEATKEFRLHFNLGVAF
ncbi:MAG: outer membrane protein assembly factor [Proteobacteria bacterium ST_bin12]|nr:MAG: outer membrane protein assembly factor [Proteobacteria bacterium ST_bin12]